MHTAVARCGTEFIVDNEESLIEIDNKLGRKIAWGLFGKPNHRHVAAKVCGSLVVLARELTDCPSSLFVDHINGNPLDNRVANLRCCTNQQNLRNMRSKGGSSKYKGVSKSGSRFVARIMVDGVDVYRKSFLFESEAAIQYDEWAVELFGQFAWLNRDHFAELSLIPAH